MKRALHEPPEINSTTSANFLAEMFDNTGVTWDASNSGRFVQAELPDWKGPKFTELAKDDPKRLVALLTSNTLAFHDLTFAAEAAGRTGLPEAQDALLQLLTHTSAVVREGAVYGLGYFLGDSGSWTRQRLAFIAKFDPHPEVRAAALETLSE